MLSDNKGAIHSEIVAVYFNKIISLFTLISDDRPLLNRFRRVLNPSMRI